MYVEISQVSSFDGKMQQELKLKTPSQARSVWHCIQSAVAACC
jgi:hypothetical protein